MKLFAAKSAAFNFAIRNIQGKVMRIPGFNLFWSEAPKFPNWKKNEAYMTYIVGCDDAPLSVENTGNEQAFKRAFKKAQRVVDNISRKVRVALDIDPSYKFRIVTNKAAQIGKMLLDRTEGHFLANSVNLAFESHPYLSDIRSPLYAMQGVELEHGLITMNWYIWFDRPDLSKDRLATFYFEFREVEQPTSTNDFPEVQVGSIFSNRLNNFEQQSVPAVFYEVMYILPDAIVIVREVKKMGYRQSVKDVVPMRQMFVDGKSYRCKLNEDQDGIYINSVDHGKLYLWNGRPVFERLG